MLKMVFEAFSPGAQQQQLQSYQQDIIKVDICKLICNYI